ncbi:MAG: thermonuclease family protein [Bdellovibrionaceae bacterium]|nr:thermonuclease family protein [Pseudobdellovibrionaceae bacterium]
MKRSFFAILISLPLLAGLSFAIQTNDSKCEHGKTAFRCVKYVRNYDADTITFDIPNVHPLIGDKISVRVRHVDTPEVKGKGPCEKETARMAKNLVENLLKRAKRIDLEDVGKDKYFRILADVRIDGNLLSEYLLKNKLALSYEGETKKKINWCDRLPASQRPKL